MRGRRSFRTLRHRYLIHDRDGKYCPAFDETLTDGGVRPLRLPPRSPNLNAHAERWVRSVKDECLSKLILFGEPALRTALQAYTEHFHGERITRGRITSSSFHLRRWAGPGPCGAASASGVPEVLPPGSRMSFFTTRFTPQFDSATCIRYRVANVEEEYMRKKLSRRDFARTSVAAGTAAVVAPGALFGKSAPAGRTSAAAGAAAARHFRMTMPPEVAYGGVSFDGRDVLLQDTLTPAGQTASTYPGGWREGTTIPAEYYTEEKHYLNEERVVAEQFWLMADHESRIPNPGGLLSCSSSAGGKA